MMLLLGVGTALGSGDSYSPLCSVVSCTYALSTERQLVSTATKAIQVYRCVDGSAQDVGFTRAGVVNTATVDAFCNASVGGVISRNCFLAKIYEQNGVTACTLFNSIRRICRTT
jgi:hypothetical protein